MGIEVKELPALQDIKSIVEELHRLYHDEVATGKKAYPRFVEDYISSHREQPIFLSSEGLRRFNIEVTLRGKVNAVLLTRQDVVESCLSSTVASDETIKVLLPFLDSIGIDRSHLTAAVNSCEHITDWSSIANVLNGFRLLKNVISADELESLLTTGQVAKDYVATSNVRLAFFFSILSDHNILPQDWQSIICGKKHMLSIKGKVLQPRDFSTPINRVRHYYEQLPKPFAAIKKALEDVLF